MGEFNHPYTKIGFIQQDLGVSRVTATKYLNELVDGVFLHKQRIGRSNYYINLPPLEVLAGANMQEEAQYCAMSSLGRIAAIRRLCL